MRPSIRHVLSPSEGGAALSIVILCAAPALAMPFAQYHQDIHQAVVEVRALQQFTIDEESFSNHYRALRSLRKSLSLNQKVEVNEEINFETDNAWLENAFRDYENASLETERLRLLKATGERLETIDERLEEFAQTQIKDQKKDADKQKLAEILLRPEFQKPAAEKNKSILERWFDAIIKWLTSFFKSQKAVEAEQLQITPSPFGKILTYLIVGAMIVIVGFIGWRFLLPFIRDIQKHKKTKKKGPRVILGEQIAPDETANDLLTQADLLARAGELRAAIRKGYIAALCDLSDRKILALAQYKTNRDYLSDVKKRADLYQSMRGMTDIFERHWYGDVPAETEDWQMFRRELKTINQKL